MTKEEFEFWEKAYAYAFSEKFANDSLEIWKKKRAEVVDSSEHRKCVWEYRGSTKYTNYCFFYFRSCDGEDASPAIISHDKLALNELKTCDKCSKSIQVIKFNLED